MSKCKSKFSRIKRHLRKENVSEELIYYIERQIKLRDDKVEQLKRHIARYHKVIKPLPEWFLEVIRVDSATSKLTVNPCTGRVTLKVSTKASDTVVTEMTQLAFLAFNNDIEPVTHRGRVEYLKASQKYVVKLTSGDKQFSKHYELKA